MEMAYAAGMGVSSTRSAPVTTSLSVVRQLTALSEQRVSNLQGGSNAEVGHTGLCLVYIEFKGIGFNPLVNISREMIEDLQGKVTQWLLRSLDMLPRVGFCDRQ